MIPLLGPLAFLGISAGTSLLSRALKGRGGSRSAAPQAEVDPFRDVGRAQEFARAGVEDIAEGFRPVLAREVGNALGGLNRIGALRSGAVPVALNEIGENFGRQVGAFGARASLGALDAGLSAGRLRQGDRELSLRERERRDRRRGDLLGAIGQALGAGVGFLASKQLMK